MPARQSRWDFHKFVAASGPKECWPWTSTVTEGGHPRFGAEGKHWYVHRLVWEELHGPILNWPVEIVMHLCNNPICCNPAHLMLGTPSDNMAHAGLSGSLSRPGINNGNAKLTYAQVQAIKADLRPSRAVAKDYGLEKTQVLRIRRGDQWSGK